MLSTMVTVLSLSVMLLIAVSLVTTALLERRRQSPAGTGPWHSQSHSLHSRPLLAPSMQNGVAQ